MSSARAQPGPGATATDETPPLGPGPVRRALVAVEAVTGGLALVSGALLVVRPDGALLGLPASMLAGGPFTDWRLPGAALAGLVGLGCVAAAALELRRHRHRAAASMVVGGGLVAFELVEWHLIGFHPLQVVFLVVGGGIVAASRRTAPSG